MFYYWLVERPLAVRGIFIPRHDSKKKILIEEFRTHHNEHIIIDKVFEEPIAGSTYILPGLKEYRQQHNKGNVVFDTRIAYKINENFRVSFIVNNLLNAEYSTRPGDIQPPRNFIAQLQMKF